ncbi:MAG: rRNA maturation RNase YbeY [Anaerolineaceae bacterium]|mgnify:FL=1|nr:rRNA maturation RNase YbeY [Anaerolineaceae bacterium]
MNENLVALEISASSDEFDINFEAELLSAVNCVYQLYGNEEQVSVALFVCDDAEIQALNLGFRGVDKPTDVLSFYADVQDPESGLVMLGDIVISFPTASRQAIQHNHPLSHEFVLLTVHGMLHLLGYDHATDDEESQMWALQKFVFEQLGLAINLQPGEAYDQE